MKEYKTAICVICKKEFKKRIKGIGKPHGHRGIAIRGVNMITCSKKCAYEHIPINKNKARDSKYKIIEDSP